MKLARNHLSREPHACFGAQLCALLAKECLLLALVILVYKTLEGSLLIQKGSDAP